MNLGYWYRYQYESSAGYRYQGISGTLRDTNSIRYSKDIRDDEDIRDTKEIRKNKDIRNINHFQKPGP